MNENRFHEENLMVLGKASIILNIRRSLIFKYMKKHEINIPLTEDDAYLWANGEKEKPDWLIDKKCRGANLDCFRVQKSPTNY